MSRFSVLEMVLGLEWKVEHDEVDEEAVFTFLEPEFTVYTFSKMLHGRFTVLVRAKI